MGLSACHAFILATFIVFVMAVGGCWARSIAEVNERSRLMAQRSFPREAKTAMEAHIRVKRKKGGGGGGSGGGGSRGGGSRNSGEDSSNAGKDKSSVDKGSSEGGWFKIKIGKVSYNSRGGGRGRSRDRDSNEDHEDPVTLHNESDSGSGDESSNGNESQSGIKGFFAGTGKWVAEWGIWDDYPDVRHHMQREPVPIGIIFFLMGLSALLLSIRLILSCLNCWLQCSRKQRKKRSDHDVDNNAQGGESYEMTAITGRR